MKASTTDKLIIIIFLSMQFMGIQAQQFDSKTKSMQSMTIGIVLRVKGEVYLTHFGREPAKVRKDFKIYENDLLETKDKSIVKIKLIDDTEMSLAPNSSFNFKKFLFKNKKNRRSIYQLTTGAIRSVFKNKAKPGQLNIKLQSVAMGVRGTEIIAQVKRGSDGKEHTDALILRGATELDLSQYPHLKYQKMPLNTGEFFSTRNLPNVEEPEHAKTSLSKETVALLKSDSIEGFESFATLAVAQTQKIADRNQRAIASEQTVGSAPTNQVDEFERLQQEDQRLNWQVERHWKKTLEEMNWKRKDPVRLPASVKPKPKCSYQVWCMKHKVYLFNGKTPLKMCEETATVKSCK